MQVVLLTVAAIALLGLLLGSLLRRFRSPLGFWFSFAGHMLMQLTAAVLLVVTAVVVAGKGGWFIALAVVLAAVAASWLATSGLRVWGIWKFGVPSDGD